MQKLWQDVRYALRQLRRSPGFTLTAVLILALQAKFSVMVRQWLVANSEQYQKQDMSRHVAATHVVLTPAGAGIATMQERYASALHLLTSDLNLQLPLGSSRLPARQRMF